MAIGDSFGDRGPRGIRYTTGTLRADGYTDERLAAQTRALELARQIEELLEDTRSVAGPEVSDDRTHSTRMARAMAASLVDELEALVVPSRKIASS
jgi:hypothetical protein